MESNGESLPREDARHGADDTEGGALAAGAWALRAIVKRWPVVFALVLLGAGIAFAISKSTPKIYESATLLEFDPDVIKPLGNKTDPMVGWSAIWDTKEYYETQFRIIQSDRVLSSVVRNLGLQNDPEFLGYRPAAPETMENTVATLRQQLLVDPVKGSRLFYIKVRNEKPAQAQRLSEAIAKAYIAANLEKMVSATGDTVVWLTGQLDQFKHELEQSENALHDFKKDNSLPSSTIDDLSKMIRLEMQEYDSALTRTRLRRSELAARNRELSKVDPENPEQVPASELLSNSYLAALRKQYQDATRERAELIAEGKGENHPMVKKIDEKIALSRTQIVAEIRSLQGAISRDLAIIEQQENGEATLYEGSRRRAVELNMKELEFHRLDRMRAQNEKIYGVLLEQLKEADLRRMMNTNNIRLLDSPGLPKAPIFPKTGTNLAIGILAGLVLGIAVVLGREALDNTLKTPEDIEKKLRVTFLGLLPAVSELSADAKKGGRWRNKKTKTALPVELITHENPTSAMAEATRGLRTNLMFMNPDKPYRTLLVTSSAPAEGKTTVAVSIAISLAQSGQKVCIVDCDLRRPRLHRIFDRAGDIGVMNVIVGEATVEDVAKPTVVPNLSCIPSGPIPPNSADVVASEKFRHFLDELTKRFDRIVIDSPPIVPVTDSAILSTVVDGVITVVRAFTTTVGLSRTGLRQLRDVDAPIAGAVLNAVSLDKHQYYYQGYYYARRDGYTALTPEQVAHDAGAPNAPPPPPN